jgi:hypothetical protein
MINLEELMLLLSVIRPDSSYIDGTQLYDQILMYMPRLNKFTFSINTGVYNRDTSRINLSSNEDIQRSFIGKGYGPVGSYVHTCSTVAQGKCHVYSFPYQFESFLHLNNSFQGGMFHNVRCLILNDRCPFEYQFFKLISQDFPFVKQLFICNNQPQTNQQHSSTLITFPHLISLMLKLAHVNYAEQFLLKQKAYLPRLLNLEIRYELLIMITNNFTNDVARFNCAKLKSLRISEPFVRSENFHHFFPLL